MDKQSQWIQEYLNGVSEGVPEESTQKSQMSQMSQSPENTPTWETVLADVRRDGEAERERLVQSCINLAEQLGFPKLQWRSGHLTPTGQANWRYFLMALPLAALKHELFPLLVKQVYELIDQET